ncbi:peptidase A4 family-domain-containing protein [Lentinula lateritia]|nr:peptidase A4 family-domain-containing protein [Lentinula lateritia]
MKFSNLLPCSALIFSYAARALPRGFSDHVLRRSNPSSRIEGPQPQTAGTSSNATIQYSGNWSGAVLVSPPTGEIFNSAVGTFTVPSMPSVNGNGAAAAWVGIDGDTFATAILQAGVFFSVTDQTVEYGAWYAFFSKNTYGSDYVQVSAGDVITVNIDASSNSEGIVTLTNESAGKSFVINLTSPTKLSYLGGQNAEWIIEDYTQNGGLVPLANWGTVTFVNASASTSANNTLGLEDATIFDIEQYNDIMTYVTIDSDSSVSISYA